ncbi:hypothetical protein [Marivivens sp. JLT3646]|uniref:hypothetical protein n=1 Tax=Marivivens sp. JLT3646 TaxID=1920883 RepID=UPI000A7FD397|nr:hypothetical protein [Marivivens sp. JLT3646]
MYIRGEMLLVMGLTLLLSPFALKGVEVQIHKNDTGAVVAMLETPRMNFIKIGN